MMISNLKASIRRLTTDEAGVTAVEYGVIGAVIIVVALVAFRLVGTNLTTTMNAIAAAL
jgi:pilus assembly protein Flp/PilA